MTPPLEAVLESKRALRRELADLSIAEKLRMLDAMRERTISIQRSAGPQRFRPPRRA